jgi:phosphotransacetylase
MDDMTPVTPVDGWERGDRLRALIERVRDCAPLRTAIVHPVDALSLQGALAAGRHGLIVPVLVGPRARIVAAAEEAGLDLAPCEIVDAPHSHAAAEAAVAMARDGRAACIMKGALHTDELLQAIVREGGLRTDRRLSHVFVIDTPAYPKLLLVTDAAVNICPDLEQKRDIVQNAIDLAIAIGVARPKVAILSAVETVNPRMEATVHAAALCKMAERGQIRGGVLDGPLAFDNAISPDAARAKAIRSPVAGDADILVAPDINVGNVLAKELDYLAGAVSGGLLTGAKVPVILTSRSEGEAARLASCALAHLYVPPPGPAAS